MKFLYEQTGGTYSENETEHLIPDLSCASAEQFPVGFRGNPYGVMVTNQYCPYGARRFIYENMGVGFFVQNPIRSTTSGASLYLVTETGLHGLRTQTKPA